MANREKTEFEIQNLKKEMECCSTVEEQDNLVIKLETPKQNLERLI